MYTFTPRLRTVMVHSFSRKSIATVLLLLFVSETVFSAPVSTATLDISSIDHFTFGMLISEEAHLVCDELNKDVAIPQNTQVTFTTEQNLSSKTALVGMEIPLRVAYDVIIDGQVVIRSGSIATGRVIEAKKARIFGKPGYLSICVERIEMSGGSIAVSSREFTDEGESKAGLAWVCFGVSFFILWPLIFVPFFIKGREAESPAGTRLSAYTVSDYVPQSFSLQSSKD